MQHLIEPESFNEAPISNRGCMKYKPDFKKLRDLADSPAPSSTFYKYLWQGIDSLQECFNVRLSDKFIEILSYNQAQAKYMNQSITVNFDKFIFKGSIPIRSQDLCRAFEGFSNLEFQIEPFSLCGFKYVLKNDDFILMISNSEFDWSVSVRYLSAGLCEYGADDLRSMVHSFIKSISTTDFELNPDYHRLSRVDVCTDFYSKEFGSILRPSILDGLVVPSRCKVRSDELLTVFIKGGCFETLTIGTKNSVQIQVYDKAKEIVQASGKTWFYKLWGMEAKKDVWRFEVRFFSEFLRNRSILTFEDFMTYRINLISEVLYNRRLSTVNPTDKNRSRWAYHHLYSFVRCCFRCELFGVSIGRYVTGKRDVLVDKAIKRIAGDLRSLNVLKNKGLYKEIDVDVIFKSLIRRIESDENHTLKVYRANERYKYVDCAA